MIGEPPQLPEGLTEGDLRGHAARGGIAIFVAQGCRFGLQLLSLIVLARLLPPEDFGLLAMAAAVTGFAEMFKDFGLGTATVQASSISRREVNSLFWVTLGIGGVMTGLLWLCAPFVASFYGEGALVGVVVALAVGVLIGSLGMQHQALLQRSMRFAALAFSEVAALALSLGIAVVAAIWGLGYWALVLMVLSQVSINTLLVWFFSGWRPLAPSWRGVRSLLTVGADVTGFNILNHVSRNLDDVLIGWRWGAGPLGLYNRAYRLLLLPLQQVNFPLARLALPILSRLRDSPERYRNAYLDILQSLALVTVPLIAFSMVNAEMIFGIFLGEEWVPASRIFVWLGLVGLTQPINSSIGWLFVSQGRSRRLFQWGFISAPIAIVSFFVGLPYGAIGVAAAYALTGIFLQTPLLFWFAGREGHVSTRDLYASLLFPVYVGAVVGFVSALPTLIEGTDAPTRLGASALAATVSVVAILRFSKKGRSVIRTWAGLVKALRR